MRLGAIVCSNINAKSVLGVIRNVRCILDFCGLEFEPGCIEFHKTERSVRTASSEQVRQPIYRESLDQWKRFEPWLGPLKTALGDALNHYRDE